MTSYILNSCCLQWDCRIYLLKVWGSFLLQCTSKLIQGCYSWSIGLCHFLNPWFKSLCCLAILLKYNESENKYKLLMNQRTSTNYKSKDETIFFFLTSDLLARCERKCSSMHLKCSCCWETDPSMVLWRSFKLWSSWEPNVKTILWFSVSIMSFWSAE